MSTTTLGSSPSTPPTESEPPGKGSISIGEMARHFDVSVRTLRFYEHRGLLTPHRENVNRVYSEQDRARVESILRYKRLGFTLHQIGAMIAEAGPSPGRFGPRREQVRARIAHFERQHRVTEEVLAGLRHELAGLVEVWTFGPTRCHVVPGSSAPPTEAAFQEGRPPSPNAFGRAKNHMA